MALEPKIPKRKFLTKKCSKCGIVSSIDDFAASHSEFYDGYIPICNSCATQYLKDHNFEWSYIDKLCQWCDIPFIVKEWERLSKTNSEDEIWKVYSTVFANECYINLGWQDYNTQYIKLREAGMIEDEIPLVDEEKMNKLRRLWGANYSDEDLQYLEDLYEGLLASQNVNGSLQIDQARKICKFSLVIDSLIRAGDKDVDKFLSSYDRLVKIADYKPKNTKNASDFDSFAEVGVWLEKRGRLNTFYDNVTRDIVDETLKNIESYNQRLYINESGIGEEINKRIEALKMSETEDNDYGNQDFIFDMDEYEVNDFMEEDEEFDAGGNNDGTN